MKYSAGGDPAVDGDYCTRRVSTSSLVLDTCGKQITVPRRVVIIGHFHVIPADVFASVQMA